MSWIHLLAILLQLALVTRCTDLQCAKLTATKYYRHSLSISVVGFVRTSSESAPCNAQLLGIWTPDRSELSERIVFVEVGILPRFITLTLKNDEKRAEFGCKLENILGSSMPGCGSGHIERCLRSCSCCCDFHSLYPWYPSQTSQSQQGSLFEIFLLVPSIVPKIPAIKDPRCLYLYPRGGSAGLTAQKGLWAAMHG